MDAATIQRRRWSILGVLCLSLFVIVVDNTIVNVALPTISRELGASTSQLQWVVDAYSLVFAGLLLAAGSLGDRFGRKGALQLGMVAFAVCSVLAGLAQTPEQLIAARAAMGIGAALIFPATLAILTNVFTDPSERAKAIGAWAGVTGLAVALGPVTGGWILEHFAWGAIFLVNADRRRGAARPSARPDLRDLHAPRLDPVGLFLSIVGVVSLVWATIEAPSHGWTSPTIVALRWARSSSSPSSCGSGAARTHADVRCSPTPGSPRASRSPSFFALFGFIFLIRSLPGRLRHAVGRRPHAAVRGGDRHHVTAVGPPGARGYEGRRGRRPGGHGLGFLVARLTDRHSQGSGRPGHGAHRRRSGTGHCTGH
jgi:MFS family permease